MPSLLYPNGTAAVTGRSATELHYLDDFGIGPNYVYRAAGRDWLDVGISTSVW